MDEKKILLVIEDDLGLQKQFKWSFADYEVVIAGDRIAGIEALRRHMPAVVTLDLGLPPDPANASEGLATLKEIIQLAPKTKVIVVTGNDDRENAIKAVALGAYDFYQKPIDIDILNMIVNRAFQFVTLEQENQLLQQKPEPLSGIIAASEVMQKLSRTIEKIAPSSITTLLLGESGTGKEVLARAIHELSTRNEQPFVAVNCAAIPETLLESELFGYEKGAFTGAVKQTKGKIEYAEGGTFFLDEIGDLPFALQAKLLRFMQERVVERLGGRKEIPVDVRIICATHQNMQDLINAGEFREDLYYRVSEMVIDIPPLRERAGDAMVIAKSLLTRYSERENKDIKGFSTEARQAIEAYHWPGNIRQLENKIKRAVVMSDDTYLGLQDLAMQTEKAEELILPLNLKQVREQAETEAIKRALVHAEDNVSHAAKLLGVTRPTLYTLFNKYGIEGHHIN
ncbi:MAG: PEP-CTERM-box response regulator transcription factor [Gammaproteobacteria bacterium]|nr:MAG: PEP-CTERM-box response regulator transcription factor [Gammaproteobacteria bacterium]